MLHESGYELRQNQVAARCVMHIPCQHQPLDSSCALLVMDYIYMLFVSD
jgi:hypothetical protein